MAIRLVLSAAASMRGASRAIEIMFESTGLKLQTPSWYSVRLWMLRIGLHKLIREKEKADDWIWIIDHTIQCGKEKCLVILGIRQINLPIGEMTLYHEDVEILGLYPVTQSNGEIVSQQLEKTTFLTGVPKQIVADNGPDVKAGINIFQENHPETCFIYDIKHKSSVLLKKHLSEDEYWKEFIKLVGNTAKQLQQTDLAAIAPPSQRSKSRYMNI